MTNFANDVLTALNTVIEGGEVDIEAVKELRWFVDEDIEPLMKDIYRELIIFADDQDVRIRDLEYDKTWRANLIEWRDKLKSALSRK